jgi:hypothetical protein
MPTPEQWLDIARQADAAGDAEGAAAAVDFYRKALQHDGGGDDARSALSDLTAKAGSFDEAVEPKATQGLSNTEGAINAATGGFLDAIPIVGPSIKGGVEKAGAAAASYFYDVPYEDALANIQKGVKENEEAHPVASTVGTVGGSVAPFMVGGAIPAVATRLGMAGTTGARIGNSLISGAVISGADTAARGGDLEDSLLSAGIGGGLSAAFPTVGAGVKAGWKGIRDGIQRFRGSSDVGDNILRGAFKQDLKEGKIMSLADEATAKAQGATVHNADRGGDTVKALARDVANKVPGMWGDMTKAAGDRFKDQSGRMINKLSTLVGGRVDDVAVKDQINAAAKRANRKNYNVAMDAPNAAQVWDRNLARMTTSPLVRDAIRAAERTSADRAVIEGTRAVRNPFREAADGSLNLPDDVRPTLEFWDHVKRNLDKIGQTDKANSAEAKALARILREHLDTIVPEYKNARGVAERFFDAEDAVDAGRKFFESDAKVINTARKEFATLSAEERNGLAIGYISAAIDKAKNTGDSRELMKAMFGNPAAREKLTMAFGRTKAMEIETFVRIEDALDRFRQAFGNSTTTKQSLQAVGIGLAPAASGALGGGAIGAYMSGGDPKAIIGSAFTGALAYWGRRHMQKMLSGADEKILREVGEKLLSEDPEVIRKLMTSSIGSPAKMQAITLLGTIADAAGKASAGSTAREMTAPPKPPIPGISFPGLGDEGPAALRERPSR